MSDTMTNPAEAAIEALRERIRQIDADLAAHLRRAELATACRDELLEMVATLARKPRATRRPRAVPEPGADASAPVSRSPVSRFQFAPAVSDEPLEAA